MPEEEPDDRQADVVAEIVRRRTKEARLAGMSVVEARLFAEGHYDVGDLRHLLELHCPPDQLARILL